MNGGRLLTFARRHSAFAMFAVVALGAPIFLNNAYYLSVLAFTATRLMISLGLNLLMGQAGQISLGHAAFVGIGAYGSAIMTTRWHMDPWLAMALAACIAAFAAVIIGIPTLKLKGHYLALATLGVGEIVFILLVQTKSLTNGTDGLTGIPALAVGGLRFTQYNPRAFHLLVWGVALVMLLISLNLSDSRVGRSLKGLHRSEVAARSLGVDTAFHKVQIFVVSAVFASIAGSFYAYYVQYISPDSFTLTFSVLLVTGVVIGGLGSVWGAVWGTLLVALLPEYLRQYDDYTNLVFGILVIVIMIFLPTGMIGVPALLGKWRRGISGGGRPSSGAAMTEGTGTADGGTV
ncbi:MAG TPA: branched-chain amino acid ABC transporter permease [Thermoleophilia bacterium]|nr:branched-chain amino acid ABC transporter permease [Thermoleophilia bacterium]